MAQGSIGEGPQIQYIEHRPGPNPMVLQVAPQSQIFRQVDRQYPAPSDQGMLSIGAQGGTSNQQSDRYSGSDSSVANMAIQQPSGGGSNSDSESRQLSGDIAKQCNVSHSQ